MSAKKLRLAVVLTVVVAVSSVFTAYAQFTPPDLPCDPDETSCPIDNWVPLLVIIALIYVTCKLNKQRDLLKLVK